MGAKKVKNPCSSQCECTSDYNSGSVKHRAMRFACSMGFLLWQMEWCDYHLCHVTGNVHALQNACILRRLALDYKAILFI